MDVKSFACVGTQVIRSIRGNSLNSWHPCSGIFCFVLDFSDLVKYMKIVLLHGKYCSLSSKYVKIVK